MTSLIWKYHLYKFAKSFFNITYGSFHEIVNLKNSWNEIVFDRLWYPLSILLLTVIGAKLIGPHGGLQVDEKTLLM